MSGISREEAMLNIKAIRDLWNNEYDCKSEYRDFLEDDPIETLNKAISDMEKLQKIEEIIKHNKGCIDVPASDCDNEHYKCQIERIEKILEG